MVYVLGKVLKGNGHAHFFLFSLLDLHMLTPYKPSHGQKAQMHFGNVTQLSFPYSQVIMAQANDV